MIERIRAAAVMVIVGLATVCSSSVFAADDTSMRAWADSVWDTARRGDTGALEREFNDLPATAGTSEEANRFRASLDRLRSNRATAQSKRDERRTTAREAMITAMDEAKLAEALRKAVEVQTFSAEFDDAFKDEEVMRVVQVAEAQLPKLEADHRWLDVQETLYLLRTFYEDTTRNERYHVLNDRLDAVNQRVGLIARYAPHKMHDMRSERAARLGEDPIPEYNPNTIIDWEERLSGVNDKLLKSGLRTAAREHIETAGWRPLLSGGVEALQLIGSTTALSETFPGLGDVNAVRRWMGFLDEAADRIAKAKDLDYWSLGQLLDDLVLWNQETVRLPDEVIFREFGDGAMARLDTYSEVIWPAELRRFQQATAGNFVGIGILIRHNDKRQIVVVNPLEGTPAYFAGVRPEDLVEEVNGDPTVGWSLNDAVDRITGPKGTFVTMGMRREGQEELVKLPIQRDVIKIRSVKGWWKEGLDADREPVWDWYIDPVSRIAYVRLTQFTEDTYDDLLEAWREINVDGSPEGLVLDLRHNPGGLLTSAVRISNLFVSNGPIVTGEDKEGREAWAQSANPNRAAFRRTPTVILVNKGSASASEIVAGCLQAYGAAVIVGERSFGKGSVQTVHHIASNGRLKLTTQYYRLPSPDGGRTPGRLVHKRRGAEEWGVEPDVDVRMSADQITRALELRQAAEIIPLDEEGQLNPGDPDRPRVETLLTEGIDPQLETALLLLQAHALADTERHAARSR